jgi:beta-ureidopropionase / N-carbamoyl-L-amino-acid hydrolase
MSGSARPLSPADAPQRVDADRMREDFEALSKIGATPEGGVSRPTFSDAHFAARKWFLARAGAAGLEARTDAAGNHSAVLHTDRTRDARVLVLGSHLDSVPNGGRYDGALGVMAALHVLLAVKQARVALPFALEAIDFTDEEGTLVGLLGSKAIAGTLTAGALESPRGGREAFVAGLKRAGLGEEALAGARRDPQTLAGYLELHIEQGARLEREGVQIGVVTAIVGSRSFRIVLHGVGGHAGTTPMEGRRDAAVAAARIILAVREIVVRDFPGCVATIGDVRVEPGAFNVVPGLARLALEFRSQDEGELDAIESALLARARVEAEEGGIGIEINPVGRWQPVGLDPRVTDSIERAATALGLRTKRLASGAGHDAQALAEVTPSGMIFVPSVGGVSHDPRELTPWEDAVNGANVLLGTVYELARHAIR